MTDVVIIGQSLSALRAALNCAELGLSVRVIESESEVAPADSSAHEASDYDGYRDERGAIAALARDIAQPLTGFGHRPSVLPAAATLLQTVPHVSPLLRSQSGQWAPQNEPNLWGIPSTPLAENNVDLIGKAAALRAYRDRIAPILTIGKARFLGPLITKRIGRVAHDILVVPQLRERFGVHPKDIEVAIAAPGLNETLTRVGSLTGAALAYADRYADSQARVVPQLGWAVFAEALRERLRAFSVEFTASTVESVEAHVDDTWTVFLDDGTEMSCRAVVVDDIHVHEIPVFQAFCATISPIAQRIYAEIDIEHVEGVVAPRETLMQVDDWTLRADESGRMRMHGPRQIASDFEEATDLTPRVLEIVERGGYSPKAGAQIATLIVSAPFTNVQERDVAAKEMERMVSEHHSFVPVGATFSGGELSMSVAAADRSSIALRRRLLGIAAD